jgi:hypothetical protein
VNKSENPPKSNRVVKATCEPPVPSTKGLGLAALNELKRRKKEKGRRKRKKEGEEGT